MLSPFFKNHLELKAKMVDFHGWEMPIQYSGIMGEHKNVRENVGLFDVSHMGKFKITGDVESQIQNLITNDISKISDKQSIYSPMCNEKGGIIDDVIISKINSNEFVFIVNSSNIKKDFEWITKNVKSCEIQNLTNEYALLALQGPKAENILRDAGVEEIKNLKVFHLLESKLYGIECIISRTGYTGEDGFELFFDSKQTQIWDELLSIGSKYGIKPIGLGARDTLRLEAGLMLYGNDIDETITPLEAPLKWTVKFETEFIGKSALEQKKVERKMRGFEINETKRVARKGNKIFNEGKEVGIVTSGSFSPTLGKPIGYCFVPIEYPMEKEIKIGIGDKHYSGKIVSTRFYKR
ncbi:MAG: glycine cleavage system protein T [Thaumarchaeota archaeon]|jgi:aminomethyltransferase|nr:MAG: glycine cleavage system protein T [Nitrososphaerota archaeon]